MQKREEAALVEATATTADETDGEPLLAFEISASQLEKVNAAQTMAKELEDAAETHEMMDFALTLTRNRKGDPVSLSSLSDERKEGSDNTINTRMMYPATNR